MNGSRRSSFSTRPLQLLQVRDSSPFPKAKGRAQRWAAYDEALAAVVSDAELGETTSVLAAFADAFFQIADGFATPTRP